MTQIPNNALIVVADGGGATLFRNTGSGDTVTLKEERKLSPKNLADEGPSGSRPGDQTPSQTDEATFAKQLAQWLTKMHHGNAFKEMVLIADPKTLGEMRAVLHKTVEQCIVKTLSKDYTHQTAAEIAKALS